MKVLRKNQKLFLPWVALIVTILITNLVVFADGESRPATPEEKAVYKLVMSTFDKALPAGPQGWKQTRRPKIRELQSVGIGIEEAPYHIYYAASWKDEERIREASLAEHNELTNKQLNSPKAEEEKLMARLQELIIEFSAAMEKGDNVKVKKVQAEIDKINVRFEQIQSGREEQQNEVKSKNSPRDVEFQVSFKTNIFAESLNATAKKEAPVAGALVMRTEGGMDGYYHTWYEGTTYVFLGRNWKVQRDGDTWLVNTPPQRGVPHTTVQTVVVSIEGDPARAREYIKKIDWQALKGLINQ